MVVEHDEVAELLGACQRRRLAGDALLDVAVGGDHVDVVVERAGARRGVGIEQPALVARRHRHPDRRGQALAQRAGGDLHAPGVPELRMAGSLGLPGPQRLDVGQLEAEAAEVELDVQRQAAVPARQHEAVAAQPVLVAGVVAHLPLKQRVCQRRQAHRRAGMAVAHLLHRVRRQHPNGIHRGRVEFGPVVGVVRAGKGGDLVECGHVANSLDRTGFAIRFVPP